MEETATSGQQPKRVRIDSEVEVLGKTRTPSQISADHVTAHVTSLLPAIQSLARHYHQKYTKLKIKALQQLNKIEKLSRDDFIPRSANIKFQLGASKKVNENNEYKTLADSTQQTVDSFQTSLKAHILAAAKLEDEVNKDEIRKLFCEATNNLAQITLLSMITDESSIDTATLHKLAKSSVEINAPATVNYVYMTTAEFTTLYDAKYRSESIPTAATAAPVPPLSTQTATSASRHFNRAPALMEDEDSDMDDNNDDVQIVQPQQIPELQVAAANLGRLLSSVFQGSWLAYKGENDKRTLNAKLKRFLILATEEQATDDAAAIIGNEASVDAATLSALVVKQVNEKTKKLEATVNKLQQQLLRSSKNGSRGDNNNNSSPAASKSRASQKKKSTKAPKTVPKKKPASPKATNQRRGQKKADEREQGSPAANANKKGKKSGKKKSTTKTKKNRVQQS
jgi:hypothetical protein